MVESSDNSAVIVAIPDPDDYIWKISSEKIPHLTLLYLGNQIQDLPHATAFIKHVADTTLTKFGLSVDRRGILGDKSADVLFFDKYGIDKLKDIRTYFLNDQQIRKAYDSVEQYEGWIPHLTLGYPETPAKPDKRDYPGTTWVNFNRIALWTGDYEGVEFPLKTDAMSELAMTLERGEAWLEHHGVKGMKWGVRRSDPSGGGSHKSESGVSDDARRARETAAKIRTAGGTKSLSNKELQELITRMNLEQQYSRLRTADKSFERSKKIINNATFVGKTVNDAIAFSRSPAGMALRKAIVGV
jgi:2'-5' RNA ligase